MSIRKADLQDIDLVIELRLCYLKTDMGEVNKAEELAIRSQLQSYLPTHINRDFFAYLYEIEGKVVSTAFLSQCERPANLHFINGLTGTVLNVLTFPEYRRKGYAKQVLKVLIEEAKQRGISLIDLSASPDGKPLYELLGFEESTHTAMRLRIQQ